MEFFIFFWHLEQYNKWVTNEVSLCKDGLQSNFFCIFIGSILLINTHTHILAPLPHTLLMLMKGGPNGNYIPQTKTGEFHRHESRAWFRYHRLTANEGGREREQEREKEREAQTQTGIPSPFTNKPGVLLHQALTITF